MSSFTFQKYTITNDPFPNQLKEKQTDLFVIEDKHTFITKILFKRNIEKLDLWYLKRNRLASYILDHTTK